MSKICGEVFFYEDSQQFLATSYFCKKDLWKDLSAKYASTVKK